MEFTTLLFPILFLPLCLIVFRAVPERFGKAVLLVSSAVFVCWGRAGDLAVLLLLSLFVYFTGKQLISAGGKKTLFSKIVLASGVLGVVALLGYFKYLGFFGGSRAPALGVPVGISFVTFTLLSFLADCYRGGIAEAPFFDYLLYVFFFPKLAMGPIVRFNDFVKQTPSPGREKTEAGLCRFCVGLAKKTLLAAGLSILFSASQKEGPGFLLAWLGLFAYAFELYFDFSGYTDMALGLSLCFGYTLDENFTYPYLSSSVSQFWRRWHITLGAFFRDYVYIPLGGSRKGTLRTVLNLLAVWLLTGLWHGADLTFVFWGLWHFSVIVLEKFVLKARLEKLPKPLRVAGTFLAVLAGWVFFFSPSLGAAFVYLGRLLGIGVKGGVPGTYWLLSFGVLLLLGALLSLPVWKKIGAGLLRRYPRVMPYLRALFAAALLLLSVSSMIGDSVAAFLYAAF